MAIYPFECKGCGSFDIERPMANSPGWEQPCPTCGEPAFRSAAGVLSAGLNIRNRIKLPPMETSREEQIAKLEKRDESYAGAWNKLKVAADAKRRESRVALKSDYDIRITGTISPEKRMAAKLKHGDDYVEDPKFLKREGRSFE